MSKLTLEVGGAAALLNGHVPSSLFAADVAIDDWDDLLHAVKQRLTQAVGANLAGFPEPSPLDTVLRIQTCVRECVAALDQLHMSLAHELSRRRQLELELFDMPAASTERRSRQLARQDELTQLPNRRFFSEQLELMIAGRVQASSLAVLYLELDGFETAQQVHGTSAGEELLKIVAARLSRAVRAEDMVSCMGGGEFACVRVDWLERAQLSQLADKLQATLSAPFKIGELRLPLQANIGIALCPHDGATAAALLCSAAAAMRSARRLAGGQRHAFYDESDGGAGEGCGVVFSASSEAKTANQD